jgi:uncharacterized protein (TIGR02145 family)
MKLLCFAMLISAFSGCKKDNLVGDASLALDEIGDYGYSYVVCTGTFKHEDDSAKLVNVFVSDITNEPSTLQHNPIRISAFGDGYINILRDSLGQIDFECRIIELEENTTYYFRGAYTNSVADTFYSNMVSVTTKHFTINSIEFNDALTYGQVSDVDNNTYKTIEIGSQTWMAENLKTTKFKNSTPIPLITSSSEFIETTTPAYCNYENNASGSESLGKLYNWHVIEQGNLCPSGWHIATSSDWDALDDFVTSEYECSGKALASTGGWIEAFWWTCNIGNDFALNNGTGFSAIATGVFENEAFGGFGHADVWWSPDNEKSNNLPASRYLTRDNSDLGANSTGAENNGYSVRCIKD